MSGFPLQPAIAIIVLNWNQPRLTVECLHSLFAVRDPPVSLIVVDNGSSDNSAAQIQSAYPSVKIIETGTNLGYAGGNNIGIQWACENGAEYVCILNNDTIVEPNFLRSLLAAIQSQPDVGIVTPLVAEQAGDGGCVWALGSAVNWRTATVSRQHAGEPVEAWRGHNPFEVEVASGAAMMVRAEVFEHVGLLDEKFFLYYEETDWCLRVRQAGYHILAVPSSVIWHKVSATLGATSPVIDYYMLRNHLRLISRHWSGIHKAHLLTKAAMCNLATVIAYTIKSHRGNRIPNRSARLLALRDAVLGRWGKMGSDVARVCCSKQ